MKKYLLLLFTSTAVVASAQIHHALPPEASVFYAEAMQSSRPAVRTLVEQKSTQLFSQSINADSLLSALKREPEMAGADEGTIKKVAIMIFVKCSYNIDSELKNKVLQIQKQEVAEMNFDKTAPLLERKSHLALQVSQWLRQMNDHTAAMKPSQ